MNESQVISMLYIYEQNLLKSCTIKLIATSNETLHDYILCMFDGIDEINRKLNRYLKNDDIISEKISNTKKEELYEELDNLLIGINK